MELAVMAAGGTGFMDSLSRAFRFIGASLGMAFKDGDMLLPSAFSVLVNLAMLAALIWWVQAGGGMEFLRQHRHDYVDWMLTAGVAFVGYLISYFFTAMTINLVDVRLRGGDARIGEAFADALKNSHAILWLAVVATAISLITAAIRRQRRGGLEDYAAGAVDRIWLVASFLILPAIILEDLPLRRGVDRARQIHQGNLLGIALGEVAVVVVTRVLDFVGIAAAAGLGVALFYYHLAPLAAAIAVAGLIFFFTMAITMFLRTAYYTCLFIWAVQREQAGEQALAPAPLANALGV